MKTSANKLLYVLVLCPFLLSCSSEKDPVPAPENIFDNGHLKVISSIINNKKGTIAVIYGNDLAFNTAGTTMKEHRDGEKFEMVTWKLKPMPQWYGTDMNGQMLSVETVDVSKKADGQLLFNYQYKAANTHGQRIQQPDRQKQTVFIVSQPAAVFP